MITSPSQPAGSQGNPVDTAQGQTPEQMYTAAQKANPGATTGAGSLDPTLTPVPQTQDASKINDQVSGNTTGTVFPPAPGNPAANATSANMGVPNPIPSAADVIGQGNAQTPGEKTNQTLLQKLAGIIGTNKGKTALTNEAETAAGVPALTKTVNDLNTQLEGLNNQATDLQNQATYTLPNLEQQNAEGRGITAGGLAPIEAGDLRKIQIKQGAIASQALTLKSVIYGAQGQLTLAKDAADKAATAQYEQQQQEIDYTKALIDANTPQMNKEEKNQALLVQSQLADRQNQIDQAKEDKKTIIAAATATLAAYPNDAAAHYAAQQALAESNKDQPDLAHALDLMAKYPSLATQQARADINAKNAATAKDRAQTALATSPNDTAAAPTDPNSQSILSQTGLSVAAFNFLTQGTTALSRLSASDRKNIMNEAQNYLNKNGVDISTFQSQYKAYNEVLQNNIARSNNTTIAAQEVSGTVDQFLKDFTPSDVNKGFLGLGSHTLSAQNVLDLLAGKQVNNSLATKYSFDIQTMANDLASYFAASRSVGANGTVPVPDDQDKATAAKIIADGMNTGSAKAFKDSINTNEEKVTGVVKGAVDAAQKQVWNIFGVGDKFQSRTTSSSGLPATVDSALSANAKTDNVAKTVTLPRAVWSTFGANMDAVKSAIEAKGYKLLIGN